MYEVPSIVSKFRILVLVALAAGISGAHAQSMKNYKSSNLKVSGGDSASRDDSAVIFRGKLDITERGEIIGRILRRDFRAGQNSSKLQTVTIDRAKSKVSGTIVIEDSETSSPEQANGVKVTRTEKTYGADFHIATTLPQFIVKGRAQQVVKTAITEYSGGSSPRKETNTSIEVSLQGVTIGPDGKRGLLSAE